jgi:UDP-N-acetylglucosamine 1-carboxyvinyltransferase
MPGGCNFGVRPIDQHIKGFEILGSTVTLKENAMIDVEAPDLTGGLVYFDVVSVGATINLMLAAVKAKGLTIIENAAKEPHIVDLANFLNSMGADVRGAGTDVIKIRGVEHMHGCTYSIIPDQIEAGTFMVAAVATKGDVLIKNVIPKHLESITAKLIQCGATVEEYDDSVRVIGNGRPGKCNIKTMPHPGFPTDMQPQFATMLAVANGTSIVSEGVWDSRFQYVEQLTRMGAVISVNGKAATIEGVESLNGSPVKADDLRAGAAMLIAGLIAKGTTSIENIVYIDRGYDNVVGKMKNLGADIVRISEEDKPKILEDTQVG